MFTIEYFIASTKYGYQISVYVINFIFIFLIQCHIGHQRKEVAFLEANHPEFDFTTGYAHYSKAKGGEKTQRNNQSSPAKVHIENQMDEQSPDNTQ